MNVTYNRNPADMDTQPPRTLTPQAFAFFFSLLFFWAGKKAFCLCTEPDLVDEKISFAKRLTFTYFLPIAMIKTS